MAVQNLIGIKVDIIHDQWGAPMNFHKIVRVDHGLTLDESYVTFASYYNKAAAESGGLYMSHTTVYLGSAKLSNESILLQAVLDKPESIMSGGAIVKGTESTPGA